MGGNGDDVRRLPSYGEQKNIIPEWQRVKTLLSSCFNFSCEGNVLLDDANVSYIEESPEMNFEASHSGVVSELPCSDSAVCGDENGLGVVSCITSPEIHASKYLTQDVSPIEWETNKLFPDIRKQSCRNYNSFDSSPPVEGIADTRETSKWPLGVRAARDESRPLISKHNSVCYKNTEMVAANEHDCFAKKDRFYNKVLPFPIVSKSLGSQEYAGAVNSLVSFDDDTNSHSVSLNFDKGVEGKGNNSSVFPKPVVARDTMILCNDLDSDCQVVPLSFSPNVHPDMGSVPLNYQVSMNNSVPPGTLVSSSCNSNSLVTLLNQTKDSIQPASWPRRRPQSLRVAMCYSDPEHLQATDVESPLSAAHLQEIALEDLTANLPVERLSPASTSVLSSIADPQNKANQEENNTERPLIRNVERKEEPLPETLGRESENKGVIRQIKPNDAAIMNLSSYRDSVFKASDINREPSAMAIAAAETVLKSSALLYPLLQAAQNYGGFEDGVLRSPSSDKENDPAMLSVRPKVKNISSSHSPKRKKTSPLKKNKSPRRQKSDSMKETQPKSLSLPQTCENARNRSNSVRVREEEDVWAVDDFLPVSKSCQRQAVVKSQSCDVKLSPLAAVKSSVSVETKAVLKSENIKGITTPFLDDVDLSMMNSTFSTDTGYETETNPNSVSTEDCVALREEAKKSKEVLSPRSVPQSNSVMDGINFLPCVPSPHTTPINISGTTTPNTVTEDLTDYYSICSELANLVNVSNTISCQKEAGDDTADYLSVTSEMPGVLKLPEDSPCGDLDVLQQGFTEDTREAAVPSRLPSPNQTHPRDLPENEESSVTKEESGAEDAVSPPEDVSSEPSPSNSSSHSPTDSPSQELVEVKYMQLSLSIVLAIVLHAMQSISQFMLEIFLATEQEDRWD